MTLNRPVCASWPQSSSRCLVTCASTAFTWVPPLVVQMELTKDTCWNWPSDCAITTSAVVDALVEPWWTLLLPGDRTRDRVGPGICRQSLEYCLHMPDQACMPKEHPAKVHLLAHAHDQEHQPA